MKKIFIAGCAWTDFILRRFIKLFAILIIGCLNQLAFADDESSIPTLPRTDVLMAGAKLLPGQKLTSPNGQYTFYVEANGNLVVYHGASAIWASNTWGNADVGKLTMQSDGNLVLTRTNNSILWQSNTGGNDVSNRSYSRYLTLTDSGRLVIHGDAGRPAWNSPVRYNAVRFFSRTIKNYSGRPMCLDIKDAGTANGTKIQLWDCNNYAEGDAQAFVYNSADQTLRLRSNQNKCVDFDGGGTWNGNKVQVWDCNGSYAQKFIYSATSGTIATNMNQNKCLDISGNRSSTDLNGTSIQIWDCNGTGAQQFDMAVTGGTGIPIWVNSFSFVKHNATDKCIDINNANTANGTNIQLWDCNGGPAQKFSYNKIDGTIRMVSNSSKCMDVNGGNTANNTNIQLWDCHGGFAQRFDYDFKTGQIMFRAAPSKCVDVEGNWNSNGTNIQLYDCNNSSAQQFDINGKLNRLSIDLHDVDDVVYVKINGTQRLYFSTRNPGLQEIDPSWLQNGDNEINIVLANYGCNQSSLGVAFYRNMERMPSMTRSVYLATTLNCDYQADWKYTFNAATGRIRQTQ